jgi:hypothetical protein
VYLDELASAIRESLPAQVDVPKDSHGLFILYALLVRTRGTQTSARDVHDAWSAWMSDRDPTHDSLVPFEELPPEIQSEDLPFLQAIHAVASRREHN